MSSVLDHYSRLSRYPLGRTLFAGLFCLRSPYTASIRPRFRVLRPNYAEVVVPLRRRTQNHIGTVHVMAINNGLETAMGALAEASIPSSRRWIPRGMEVKYVGKATSEVTCIAETDPAAWTGEDPGVAVKVRAERADGEPVVEGVIWLWVTDKPSHR